MLKRSQYLSKPCKCFGGDINVKVDLSNYAKRTDLKNTAGVYSSKLTPKSDLASLEAKIDKLKHCSC